MVNRYIQIILLILLSLPGISQDKSLSDIIFSIAEDLASDETNPEAAEQFIEQLNALYEDPVKINSADETDLSLLFFLTDFQIKAIIDYIKISGRIVSVYEISAIPGFDRGIVEMMIPFITLDSENKNSHDKMTLNNTLLTNLIFKPGAKDTSHLGSHLKILTRYKFTAGRLSAGFTSEKDAGEKFLSGSPPMPDFLSGYFAYQGTGILKKIIAGDFSSSFGLGTNINTGIRTGFSVNSTGYLAGKNIIKPYTSSDENNYFRGTAADFEIGNLGFSLMLSHKKTDATLNFSGDSSLLFIENLYKTGLHNTSQSVSKKDAVTETLLGINLRYNLRSFRIGVLWSENMFSLPFNVNKEKAEYLFKFEGKHNNILTVWYNSTINRFLLFGEISVNNLQNVSIVQGMTIRPSDRLSVNLIFRNYSPGFNSFHANGPGRNSYVNNEKGILGNFTFEAGKHLFISAGCDISHFPWLKYRCSSPSTSKKQEIKIKYNPDENLSFDLSWSISSWQYNSDYTTGIAPLVSTTGKTLKGQVKYIPHNNLTLTTRADFRIVHPSGSRGTLLLQDLIYRFRQVPLKLWFRYCIFRTDDWDSRLYTYENDLLYSYSIPTLSGKGSRTYFMAEWEIKKIAELRFKYGLTSCLTDNSKYEETRELKAQIRIWF
jgi:hypothetical protein